MISAESKGLLQGFEKRMCFVNLIKYRLQRSKPTDVPYRKAFPYTAHMFDTHRNSSSCRFFDMVYQLRFRSLPLSNTEILESDAKQHIEHAYYLSENLSLF